MIWRHSLQTAITCIITLSTLTHALFPNWPNSQATIHPHFQQPLEDPDCDGSGLVPPDGHCNGDGVIINPPDHNRGGFRFDNPSTDCKYVTQMYIYDVFKVLEKDMGKLFTYVHKDVDFHVMGHHPVAGHYHDLLHFYVNALRRVSVCFSEHAERFEVHPQAIHGGCDSPWSVAEIMFRGLLNTGDPFEVVNVWVTRWHKGQMVEARTYIDQGSVTDALRRNELWTNGTSYRENRQYMPGPSGMPDLEQLKELMHYPDGREYEDL